MERLNLNTKAYSEESLDWYYYSFHKLVDLPQFGIFYSSDLERWGK